MSQEVIVGTVATQVVVAGLYDWIHIHNASAVIVYLSYDGTPLTAANGVPLASGARIRFDNANKPYIFVKGVQALAASGTASLIVAYSASFVVPALPYNPISDFSRDNYETYSDDTNLNALNGGSNWVSDYVSRSILFVTKDTLETYTLSSDLGGLNAGVEWDSAYVSKTNLVLGSDDFESYTATAVLDTLNAGSNWSAAYVSRP